jgi:hypothetical protein
MFTCRSMRVAVILSALLLVGGLGLGVTAMSTPLVIPTTQLSLLLVLAGALVLSITFFASLLPPVARRLDECQH